MVIEMKKNGPAASTHAGAVNSKRKRTIEHYTHLASPKGKGVELRNLKRKFEALAVLPQGLRTENRQFVEIGNHLILNKGEAVTKTKD